MAKTTAPLLSMEASGQIGSTLVASKWKGRAYMRRYTVPANPNTSEQQLTRNTFKWLNNVWKFMPGSAVGAWQLYADTSRITDRNGFIKINNGPLREQTDLTDMILSPSARSGLVAADVTPTPSAGQISVALTPPVLPTGWTVTAAFAACIRDQDPQTEAFYEVTAGTDATSTYAVVLTGLDAADYLVGGWFQYARPDGTPAYGQSLQEIVTVT